MKKVLKTLLKIVLWLFGLVLLLVLVVFGINSFDEEITPETAALLKQPLNPYAPEQNLYIALVGFDAPEGQSVTAVGQARITENEVFIAKLLADPQASTEAKTVGESWQRLAFKGKTDFCRFVEGSCWTGVEIHQADISRLLEDNRELYRRYLALHSYPGFFETGNSIYSPILWVPAQAHALFLTNIALRIKTGATDDARRAALFDLRNDVNTWRRMLLGNGALLSKVLAIVSLQSDYVLLGDMIADPSVDLAPLSATIQDITEPDPVDDWKLRNLFANEFRMIAPTYEQLRTCKTRIFRPPMVEVEWWEPLWTPIQGHFLKVNATQNGSARTMIELQKVADADPREFLGSQEGFERWRVENFSYGPAYIYNPVGKTLVAMGTYSWGDWSLRSYDVAAYGRVVRLAYEIRNQQVPVSEIPAFIRQHPEWATHPVSGEAFVWDAEKRELRVQPMAHQPAGRRFNVPVWTRRG